MRKYITMVVVIAFAAMSFTAQAALTSAQKADLILASNGTITTVPAPSIKSNGECKPTIVSSAISDEKLAQLARELRRENEKKAAALRKELYGEKGSAKNPKGGVIGGIIDQMKDFKDVLQEVDDKVKGEAEARKLLDARVEAQGKRLERTVEVVNVHADMINKNQKMAIGAYNQSIAGLVLGVIGTVLGVLALAWLAFVLLKSRRAAAASHTP